jgi:hypothetical protein
MLSVPNIDWLPVAVIGAPARRSAPSQGLLRDYWATRGRPQFLKTAGAHGYVAQYRCSSQGKMLSSTAIVPRRCLFSRYFQGS